MGYSFTSIIIDDDPAHTALLIDALLPITRITLLGTYTSFVDGMEALHQQPTRVDILFCDIMLLDANGLEHGPQLAGLCKLLIYVTGHAHLKEGVLDALGDDCLVKPVSTAAIQSRVLGRLLKRYGDDLPFQIRSNKLYMYNAAKKITNVAFIKQVMYIEHSKNYLNICVLEDDGEKVYKVRGTVAEAMALLAPYGVFSQANPSTIINANFITDDFVSTIMIRGKEINVTAAYRQYLRRFIQTYTLGRR